jgi:hypothetical protein
VQIGPWRDVRSGQERLGYAEQTQAVQRTRVPDQRPRRPKRRCTPVDDADSRASACKASVRPLGPAPTTSRSMSVPPLTRPTRAATMSTLR